MPKNANAEKKLPIDPMPLVNPHRGKFTEFATCTIETPVHSDYTAYKEFVERKTGVRPEPGAIVSAALELLFKSDTLFQTEVKNNKKTRVTGESNGTRGAGRSATNTASVVAAK